MVPYNPGTFRPVAVSSSPTARRQVPSSSSVLGQKFDELFNWGPVAGDILRLIAHGMAGYLGYYVWLTAPKTSFPRYFGLAMGIIQTVGALSDVVSLYKRAAGTHPPEPEVPPAIPISK